MLNTQCTCCIHKDYRDATPMIASVRNNQLKHSAAQTGKEYCSFWFQVFRIVVRGSGASERSTQPDIMWQYTTSEQWSAFTYFVHNGELIFDSACFWNAHFRGNLIWTGITWYVLGSCAFEFIFWIRSRVLSWQQHTCTYSSAQSGNMLGGVKREPCRSMFMAHSSIRKFMWVSTYIQFFLLTI